MDGSETVRARLRRTARPPFMSAAPTPKSRSPSRRGSALSGVGGTVSRWPATTTRRGRPRLVRATTLSPPRAVASHGHARSADSTRSAIGPSAWLSEGTPMREAVSARRSSAVAVPGAPASGSFTPSAGPTGPSPVHSHRDPVLSQDVVEQGLVVAVTLGEPPDDQHARQGEPAPRVLAPPRRRHRHRPRWHVSAADLFARSRVDHRDRGVEDGSLPEDGAAADTGSLGDHG